MSLPHIYTILELPIYICTNNKRDLFFFIFDRCMKLYIYILYILSVTLYIGWFAVAQNNGSLITDSELISQLAEQGIDTQSIRNRSSINRYEYTRLLSTLDCQQCSPSTPALTTAITQRNEDRNIAQTNLDDLILWNMIYKDQDVSYCVAHVVSNGWMNGFPRGSSPLCPGKFCGSNTLVFGDLIQSLYNYSAPYKLNSLEIDRVDIGTWIQSLWEDIDFITSSATAQAIQRCWDDPCPPINDTEADIYARYCQYNLSACSMRSTQTLDQWKYPLWHINILHDRWVLDMDHIILESLGRYDAVPGDLLMDIYIPLIEQAKCPVLMDFDYDGIRNSQDLCPLVYDPHQRDLDGDKIWDVCDEDIDGDGETNALWAIDDAWNIDPKKWWTHDDNCLMVSNPDQNDNDNNTRWDACEWQASRSPVTIQVDPSWGNVGTNIQATSVTTHDHIVRSWWDGAKSTWEQSDHIYTKPDIYTLVARTYDPVSQYIYSPDYALTGCPHISDTQCIVSVAKKSIYIGDDGQLAAWLLWYSDPQVGTPWQDITLKHDLSGNISKIIWTIWSRQIETGPTQDITHRFAGAGIYTVKIEWYAPDNSRVGLSQFNIEIQETLDLQDTRAAHIQTQKLEYEINEIIDLQTVYTWFEAENVKEVIRSLWSENTKITEELTTSLRLTTPGHILVEQTIAFVDQYPDMTQYISIHVWASSKIVSNSLTAEPLIAPHHSEIQATLETTIATDDIYTLDRDRGDDTRIYMESAEISLENTHLYTSPGIYRIRTTTNTKTGEVYIQEQTIHITSIDLCEQHFSGESLLKCDMDTDGIPDRCDDDIDGDGVENLIGILLGENTDCEISVEIIDSDRLQQQVDIAKDELQNPGNNNKKDNCFVVANPEQTDSDSDGLWDICDNTPTPSEPGSDNLWWGWANAWWEESWWSNANSGSSEAWWGWKDSDGDWSPDSSDGCPSVPWSQWWCPQITPPQDPNNSNNSIPELEKNKLRADTCTECPCPFVDYAAEVLPGDRVRAVLTDPWEERVYSVSAPAIVRE